MPKLGAWARWLALPAAKSMSIATCSLLLYSTIWAAQDLYRFLLTSRLPLNQPPPRRNIRLHPARHEPRWVERHLGNLFYYVYVGEETPRRDLIVNPEFLEPGWEERILDDLHYYVHLGTKNVILSKPLKFSTASESSLVERDPIGDEIEVEQGPITYQLHMEAEMQQHPHPLELLDARWEDHDDADSTSSTWSTQSQPLERLHAQREDHDDADSTSSCWSTQDIEGHDIDLECWKYIVANRRGTLHWLEHVGVPLVSLLRNIIRKVQSYLFKIGVLNGTCYHVSDAANLAVCACRYCGRKGLQDAHQGCIPISNVERILILSNKVLSIPQILTVFLFGILTFYTPAKAFPRYAVATAAIVASLGLQNDLPGYDRMLLVKRWPSTLLEGAPGLFWLQSFGGTMWEIPLPFGLVFREVRGAWIELRWWEMVNRARVFFVSVAFIMVLWDVCLRRAYRKMVIGLLGGVLRRVYRMFN